MRLINKGLLVIGVSLICEFSFAQSSIHGKYECYFGSRIKLSEDSTFSYRLQLDTYVSWTKGKWHFKNDTIYLDPIIEPIERLGNAKSINTYEEYVEVPGIPDYAEGFVNELGGQNDSPPPNKLYCKKGRLYLTLANGKLNRKKYRPFRALKKHPTYYYRYDFPE